MRLSCIRHGITADNLRNVFRGPTGDGLTPAQSAELRGLDFDTEGFDAVYCSPAVRCRETAECLGIASFIEDARLTERHFGVFEGLSVEDVLRTYPDFFASFRTLDADFVIPGGESRAQHRARVLDWVREVAEAYETVLAVTHGGTVDFLYRLGSGRPPHGGGGVYAGPNAALSVFEVTWPDVAVLTYGERLAER